MSTKSTPEITQAAVNLLSLHVEDPALRTMYKAHVASAGHAGDAGIDLFFPETVTWKCGETKMVDLKVRAQMVNTETNRCVSYQLYPRSSISKGPLRLANSVGIIDAGYRGTLRVAVQYVPTSEDLVTIASKVRTVEADYSEVEFLDVNKTPTYHIRPTSYQHLPTYTVEAGTRLFQLCVPTLEPIAVCFTNSLTQTSRGDGGFGSTGAKSNVITAVPHTAATTTAPITSPPPPSPADEWSQSH
ncbi:hypothetical protein OAM67_00135 [bacterium]|nr:hypothetical protein [bacterium]